MQWTASHYLNSHLMLNDSAGSGCDKVIPEALDNFIQCSESPQNLTLNSLGIFGMKARKLRSSLNINGV